jgi:hypothetical protein
LLAFVFCASLSGFASAAGDAAGQEDYAYGWPIEAADTRDYYELMLPLEAYRAALHESLWDVAVFNAEGAPVPRFLDQPPVVERRASWEQRLPVLPLWEDPARPGGALGLKVTRSASGEIVEFNSRPEGDDRRERILRGYVADARSIDQAPERLMLEWEPIAETFLGQLRIEASDDLTSWRQVGRGAVAGLRQGEEVLLRREIAFKPGKADFYRLTWNGLPATWRLLHVDAFVAAEWQNPIERRHIDLEPVLSETDEPAAGGGLTRLFDAGGHLLVDAVQVNLETKNSVARARVYSGSSPTGPWRQCQDGVVYRLGDDEDSVDSEPVSIGPVRARYWRVVLNGVPATEPVALRLAWRPDRLGFLAQGAGPYRLLAGSTKERSAGYPLQQRFADPALKQFWVAGSRQESRIGRATLGGRFTILGPSALTPAPRPLPWKTGALWAVLLAAVLLVVWMALTLSRQLKSPS